VFEYYKIKSTPLGRICLLYVTGSCFKKTFNYTPSKVIFLRVLPFSKKYSGFLRHGKIEMPKIGKVEEKKDGCLEY